MPEAETMYVVPRQGRSVPMPESRDRAQLPAEGATVPRDSYWLRRLAEGDVTEGKAKPASKKE